MRSIQAALAAILLCAVHPAVADVLHIKGVNVPPIQTVEQARVEAEKKLAVLQAQEAEEAAQAAASQATFRGDTFFTGKPLVEETGQYAFLFRHYDPELNRWTTSDPSGFPDGANNLAYAAVPTTQFDWQGLFTLSTTTPSVSSVTDQATGTISAFAWDLQHVAAGSSAASIATGLISQNTAISQANLAGSVTVSNFFAQNHSSSQSGNNPNVASVSLTLHFQSAPSGFGWIQIYRKRLPGQGFGNWQLDISSGAGPAYTAGPILVDVPAVGIFSQAASNGGDGGEMQIYTFAALRDTRTSTWTLHDGIFWGGHVHE